MIKYALLDVADVAVAAAAAAAAVESSWSWRLAQFFGPIIYNWLQIWVKKKQKKQVQSTIVLLKM